MVSGCEWNEFLLELELCTRLAQFALDHHDNDLVCSLYPKSIRQLTLWLLFSSKVLKCVSRVLEIQRMSRSRDLASVTSTFQHHCLDKYPPPPGQASEPTHKLESELLSQAYSFQGQALVATANGHVGVIRRALDAFLDSARSTKQMWWLRV